jgi:hypothetical protein
MTRFRGEYVPDRKALHNAVRASVGNRCIRCGHPQGDWMEAGTDESRIAEIEQSFSNVRVRMEPNPRHGHEEPSERWRAFVLASCDDRCTHEPNGKLRILTVHHLTGQKDDNRWWNLLALCQVCHLQIQGKVIPEQAYLHPHSPWFVPYVCGFYAATIGGVDITREESDADPRRWLKLGQPWLYPEEG